MATAQHDGHPEPSLVATALPVALLAILALWMFVSANGYLGESIIAFLAWIGICFWVVSSFPCRNANHLTVANTLKFLVLMAFPYGLIFWYSLNVAPLNA